MPGIAGIISGRPREECERSLQAMLLVMQHEPFYVSGRYVAPEIGVYGGWVAHSTAFTALQPFANEQGDIALLFSGECFWETAGANKVGGIGEQYSSMGR